MKTRESITIERASLTPKQRAAMLAEQDGVCAWPECESAGPFVAEHWLPVQLGNTEKPDCLLCVAHAKLKTKTDMSQIARAKRREKYQKTGRGRARKGKALPLKNFQPKPEGYKFKWPKRAFRSGRNK